MKKPKDPNVYPPGLDAKKVREIIAYYDARDGEDLLDDPDHELISEPTAWLEVPVELVPKIRKMLSRHRKTA